MNKFPVSERIDMYNIYIQCEKNSTLSKIRYNEQFPEREQPHRTIFKRIEIKLTASGSFVDRPANRPAIIHENDEINVLAYFEAHPRNSTRDLSRELNISQTSIIRILKKHSFKPWKLSPLQLLNDDDKRRRLEFCNNMIQLNRQNNNFIASIIWTDESSFSTNGVFNRKTTHYWARQNPRQFQEIQWQGRQSVGVWCGIARDRIIGPIFYQGALTGQRYLNFLENEIEEYLDNLPLQYRHNIIWQQDGAPQHHTLAVRNNLNQNYNTWIGRNGTIPWPPRSPDLSPLDFYLWGHLKNKIYEFGVNNLNEIKDGITAEIENINNQGNVFHRLHEQIIRRLNLCINEEGGHIEHLL